jgi:hypothetical protein
VLPLLTSLSLHLGCLLLGLITYKAIVAVRGATVVTIIPDDVSIDLIGENGKHGGVPDPGISDNGRQAMQNLIRDVDPENAGWSQKPGSAMTGRMLAGLADTEQQQVIGLPMERASAVRTGRARHNLTSSGDDDGRPALFGPQPDLGGRPRMHTIFDRADEPPGAPGQPPQTVVYVCDASGSMVTRFDDLRGEIRRALGGLRPSQSFNVIFFRGEQAMAASPARLLINTGQNRAKTGRFLEDVAPAGETNPIPALEMAFRQQPRMIWLLTDGDFPDNQAVLDFIRKHNTRKVIINTVAFVTPGDSYERVLRTIAQENGGIFRFVKDSDLQGRDGPKTPD